jgi:predicted negative regulator of RcsB-dependent stress response
MAIDDLLDEHEQGRRVQEWLRRNGGGLIGGVLLGLAAVGGWKWWERHQAEQDLQAAEAYQTAVDSVEAEGVKAATRVNGLPQGMYRSLASLELAQAQADAGQREAAIATLRSARPDDPTLQATIDLRIARLLIDGGKPADALALAKGETPLALEVQGDAQFALGRQDEARESYRKALAGTEVGSPQRRLLELKYTQVGGVPVDPQTP